jgi:predicted dehydrogenase
MLNVAVVGLGWWGKIIASLLGTSTKLKVVRAIDANPAARAVADAAGVPFDTTFESALADPVVQGVVLCTPHSQHTAQIVAAAEAGKHVFCEKPLSLTLADAKRAVAAIERAGVALGVGHERRFEPPIVEAMRLVHTGELGTPLQMEANFSQDKFLTMPADNWRLKPGDAPAGPLTATGIHLLDLAVGVFGAPSSAYASVKQLGSHLVNGDTLAIHLSFERGGHALISAILATPFDGRFAVYCSHGWVEVRDKAHPESPEGWTLTVCRRGGARTVTEYAPAHAVLANLEAFAGAAAGRAPYLVPREQMLWNIAALEAVVRSTASGQVETVGR